jgi:CheY-like chemotaxis protein
VSRDLQLIADERRRHTRGRVDATATLWVLGQCKGAYLVENLSQGGAFLSGGPAVRPGMVVKVVFQLPRGRIDVTGTVLRSEPQPRDCSLAVSFNWVSVPARKAIDAAVAEALASGARDSAFRPEPTVLVVDDSVLIRESLTRDIRSAGREPVAFSTSLDALDFLHRPQSLIQVALIDLIGSSGGDDLLAFLADEHPSIRRVVMCDRDAVSDAVLARFAREVGAVLAKPWDPQTLARSIG